MKKSFIIIGLLFSVLIASAQKPDRSGPPPLLKAKNLQLPPLQKFALSNGVRVLLMEKHGVPLIQLNVLLQTGNFDDPAGKEGLNGFTMDLLDEGAGAYNALQLADEIEFLGASISTYSGNFTSGINCTTPASRLDAALRIVGDLVLRPTFADAEIERVRALRLNSLLQGYSEPNTIARRAFDKLMYDPSLPYGKFPGESSIRSFTSADVKSNYQRNFVAGNATLIIVGDVTRETIVPLLEKHLGAIPAGTVKSSAKPVAAQVKGRTIYIVDKPGAAQSVIRIGRIGADRSTTDYNSLMVLNTILGGSFTSRLNNNLREIHGYSYGAGSSFTFWKVPGPFVASSSVQTDATGPALGEFFNEFKNISKIPDDEFARGRNYEALGYAGNFEGNAQVAGEVADQVIYNLPDDYFNTYVEKILAVSKKSVDDVAKKYINPANMLVVVVGDRAKIEEGIKKLNLGKVQILSVEDVLGKKPVLEQK